jgi:hypothetical protein
LGDHDRFALRLEWLTVLPEAIPLLQISQYLAIFINLSAKNQAVTILSLQGRIGKTNSLNFLFIFPKSLDDISKKR